jgi:hypothetical protein
MIVNLFFCCGLFFSIFTTPLIANKKGREWHSIYEIPPLPAGTQLADHEKLFAYRGRIGFFRLPPSVMGCYFDSEVNYTAEEDRIAGEAKEKRKSAEQYFLENGIEIKDKEIWHDNESIKVMYDYKPVGRSFCGAYLMFFGDLSQYGTMTFMIKGENGGEQFQIGMNDAISNKREDAVFIGSINRFVPGGRVTRDWQIVRINMREFFGPDLSKVMSLVFDINEESRGTFWIDDLRLYKDVLYNPIEEVHEKGYLLLDNFDFSYLNLLGRKTNTYKKLPSVCLHSLDDKVFYGDSGKSLRLDFDKQGTGWSGYYSMLNQVDGEWFDLSEFDKVSFMVKGAKGGENFEIGMADKNWVIIGDSLKGGTIGDYLPGGVTTEWQEVVIPLSNFGLLDLTEMGSFVINFITKHRGTIWIDDLKFYIKQEQEEEPDW